MRLHLSVLICVLTTAILSCRDTEAQSTNAQPDAEAKRDKVLGEELVRLNGMIAESPSRHHHARAEVLFRLGRFNESVGDYNVAAQFGWPHDEDSCWERGLAQYYVGDYRAGAEQFARYHRVGALDIENGLWRFLCIAEDENLAKARETMFEYSRKLRTPFPALLALYMGHGSADAVLEEANRGDDSDEDLTTNLFYAHYYLGKYYEVTDRTDLAMNQVQEALTHRISHFMYACAEADAKRLAASLDSNAAKTDP